MKKSFVIICILFFCVALVQAQDFGEPDSTWYGYDMHSDVIIGGIWHARVVAPDVSATGNPWVMRALWPDHATQIDQALLDRGYHIVYLEMADYQYGSATPIWMWDRLYSEMVNDYGMSTTPILEGSSRGGLQIHNWAIQNVDKVQSIYGLVPVCDFKSWPGPDNTSYWETMKSNYGFTSDAEALAYDQNPVDTVDILAATDIPILYIVGTADTSVPYDENGQLYYNNYLAAGGDNMELIIIDGGEHHTTFDMYSTSVGGDLSYVLDYLTVSQTPEPATISLLVIGAIGLFRNSRK